MRLIKPNDYDVEDFQIAFLGDAFSHPVRKKIIEHLHEEGGFSKADYSKLMNLSKVVVGRHIKKLKEAKLIKSEYFVHHEILSLDTTELEVMYEFIGKLLGK